jgi:hypothetical protein
LKPSVPDSPASGSTLKLPTPDCQLAKAASAWAVLNPAPEYTTGAAGTAAESSIPATAVRNERKVIKPSPLKFAKDGK